MDVSPSAPPKIYGALRCATTHPTDTTKGVQNWVDRTGLYEGASLFSTTKKP